MLDREQIMYPMQGADPSVSRIEPWIPQATVYDSFQGYTLLRSSPESSSDSTVQFTVRGRGINGDLMRLDSYREGYYGAVWWSTISLEEFLQSAEAYFQDLNQLFTEETSGTFGVFTAFRERELYEFRRPLALADLQEGGVFLGDESHPLGLFRMDTPAGDVTIEPEDQRAGLIQTLEPTTQDTLIQAAAKFVSRTQGLLTPDVVTRVLTDLPYRKTA